MDLGARLQGKKAVVTAAGQGIGQACVARLCAEGAHVIAADINPNTLSQFHNADGVTPKELDVTDGDAIRAFATETGTIDVLVNCVGFVHSGTILDASEEDFDVAVTINMKSQFRMIRAFLPGMLAQKSGSIINMSSVAGPVTNPANRTIYSMTKAAVSSLTRSIATDFVTQGIRCNAICPGTVDTPSLHERLRETGDYDAAMKAFVARQPIGRLGKAQEIAALVAYLASDEAAYTTGTDHVIDGGWNA